MRKGKAEAGPSTPFGDSAKLRVKAETKLKKRIEKIHKESKGDFKRALHELHVHQIELEMQNEELRRAQLELETSRNKYSDLYDFAPVGYFAFDKNGLVIEANLTGCRMLGIERANLIKKPFGSFIDKESQDKFYLHRKSILKPGHSQSCDITLVRKGGDKLEVRLDSIAIKDIKGNFISCRTTITDIAEHRQLEQFKDALRDQAIEERNRLEAVMEALPVGMVILDAKGGNVESNAAFEKIWLGPLPTTRSIKDYVKYKAWWADTGKPVKPEEWASAIAIKKGKTVTNQLIEIERFDGSRAFVLNSASPVRDSNDKVIGSAVAIQDITAMRKAEEELRKLASVVEHTSEFISLASLDEKIIFLNEAGDNMLGIPTEEIGQIPVLKAISEDFKDKVQKEVFPALKKKGHWEGDLQYLNLKTGKITDVYATTFTINDPVTGKPLYLANTSIDITERKRAEEAIQKSQEKAVRRAAQIKATLDAAPAMIWTALDSNCKTIIGNKAAYEFSHVTQGFNLSKSSPSGAKKLAHYRHFKDGIELTPENMPIQRVAATGKELKDYSLDFVFDEGTIKTVLGNVSPIFDLKGKPAGAVAVFVDITERRKNEEQLTRITEDLQRSNRDLEQFAYVTSHDLKEPLRAIGGFVELLQRKYKDKLDRKADEYIEYALSGTKRMHELITGLLAYSRVQTTGEKMIPIPSAAALREAKEKLQKDIEETKAVITNDELPEIRADGRQIIQVFAHLIDNAIKFRSDEKPKIHIGCEKKDGTWQFAVSDNGIGIDSKFHNRVFDIFQRLHSRDKYPGYGVGLTVCRRIVERHGGTIWVESQPGKGATFYFTIPDLPQRQAIN